MRPPTAVASKRMPERSPSPCARSLAPSNVPNGCDRRTPARNLSAPSPMHPEPLIGMLPNPALDDRSDHLHRAGNVDLAVAVAGELEHIGTLQPEAAGGKANGTCSMDRAVQPAGELSERRVHLAAAPEEHHVDAAGEVLVDQHAH